MCSQALTQLNENRYADVFISLFPSLGTIVHICPELNTPVRRQQKAFSIFQTVKGNLYFCVKFGFPKPLNLIFQSGYSTIVYIYINK